MNSYLQIMIGLSPGFLLFLLLGILSRKKRLGSLLAAGAFASGILVCLLLSFGPAAKESDPVSDRELPKLEAEYALELVYALASEGNYEEALALHHTLCTEFGYDESFSLCLARIYAGKGNFAAAASLYAKLPRSEEASLAAQAAASSGSGLWQEAQEAAADAIDEAVRSSGAENLAQVMRLSEELYDALLLSGSTDLEAAENLVSDFASCQRKHPEYFSLSVVQISQLKSLILSQDYDAVADTLSSASSYEAVMIASELYIQDALSERSFRSSAVGENQEALEAVLEVLNTTYPKLYDEKEDPAGYNNAGSFLENLEDQADKPGYAYLKNELLDYASSDGATDASKAYIQLSKLENAEGNAGASLEYLDAALVSVGSCSDDSFAIPMSQIVSTVTTQRDDTERLKDIPQQVDQVLDNTLPFNIDPETLAAPQDSSFPAEDASLEDPSQEDTMGNYSTLMTDQISKMRATINILNVDTSAFPNLTAHVTVDSSVALTEAQLQSLLSVKDCGIEISEFTVEKVDYATANILLCCDISGSMDGKPTEDLTSAIDSFIRTASEIENISLVCFNSGVVSTVPFGSTQEELLQAVAAIRSGGGTDMFSAMEYSISTFTSSLLSSNCIILISDGEDGNKRSADYIAETISEVCAGKGIEVYALGLGYDVDSSYLDNFTLGTGGFYLYADSSETLEDFFQHLRSQFLNRYTITYQAEDTLTNYRPLNLQLNTSTLAYDESYYSLDGNTLESPDWATYAGLKTGVSITGVDKKLVYRGQVQNIQLFGTGFTRELPVSLELRGNLTYQDIPLVYVNGNTYTFTLPATISCGTYDLRVKVDGRLAVLTDAITVAPAGGLKQIDFGPYSFTAFNIVENGDSVTLSSYVTMNGWLHFSDSVTLTGDLTGGRITLSTAGSAYTLFEQATSQGLATWMAERGMGVTIPLYTDLTLYNDQTHSPSSLEYPTQAVTTRSFLISNLAEFSAPGLRLYPHLARINVREFTTKFPMQDTLVKTVYETPFTVDYDADLYLSGTGIDMRVETTVGSNQKKMTPATLLNMKAKWKPGSIRVLIDTLKNEYEVELEVSLNFLPTGKDSSECSLGLELGWKDSKTFTCPTKVVFEADFPIKGTLCGIPVTYEKFKLGAEDIDPDTSFWEWKLMGGMDVTTKKLSETIPNLEKFIGDFNILAIEDALVSLKISDAYIKAEAKAVLCNIQFGSVLVEAGKFSYTNLSLGLEDVDTHGLRLDVSAGYKLKTNNCNLDVQGTLSGNLHSRFIGLQARGNFDVSVQWWVFRAEEDLSGDINFGIWRDNRGVTNFGIVYSSTNRDQGTRIVYNAETGADTGKISL